MKRGIAVLSAAVLLGLLLTLFASRRLAVEAPSLRQRTIGAIATPQSAPQKVVQRIAHVAAASPTANAAIGSLRGSDVDGAVHLDASSHVIVDRDLRRAFDYFLERVGEQPLSMLREQLRAWLDNQSQLNDIARSETMTWFDAYLGLQQASAGLGSSDASADLQRLSALRRERLGDAVAAAWFGAEESEAQIALERIAIAHDTMLDAAQRAQKLDALDQQRDPVQRGERAQGVDFEIAAQQSRQYAEAGTDAATRYAERAAQWGDEAAQRLAELDRQQADWSARLSAYVQERNAILADVRLADTQRATRLAALLQNFSEPEQRRVVALSEAGLLPSKAH